MFRRSVLFTALLMELMMMVTMNPLTSSARHVINKIDTRNVLVNHVSDEESVLGDLGRAILGRQRRHQQDETDDDDVVTTSNRPAKTSVDVACSGADGRLCRRDSRRRTCRNSHCGHQRRETLAGDLLSLIKSVKDGRQIDDSPAVVKTAMKRIKGEVARYPRQLTNENLSNCRRRPASAGGDVIGDITALAAAANKRRPSGNVVTSLMDLCSSYGGHHQTACFNRYLKNFARHITTSGNKFVGR